MALADGEHCGGFCKALSWPAPSRLASFFPCANFFRSSVTLKLLYYLDHWELALPIFFFLLMLCLFFFFSFKASSEETALSILCRSFFHGEEQEGVPSAMRFHLLNPISGSHRSLPCRAQFAASPEAWGRGPSRRRVILRTLSLLGETNVLCYVWCVPSIPPAERQKSLHERQRALQ